MRSNHPERILLVLLLLIVGSAHAGIPVDVVRVDLPSLIDKSAVHPNRFAVDIPRRTVSSTDGTWVRAGANAVWRFSVRIPTAVSISFHADSIQLPPSAQLRVTGGGAVYAYGAKDIHGDQLWSRVARGDQLNFELTVPVKDQRRVLIRIASLQAGYRSLDRTGRNHPYYDNLRRKLQVTASVSCVENYECDADASNQGPAQSTVALLIANIGQCSGTLLNDVPEDGIPFVLTARHCENDTLGGGAPLNAGAITVYWDATTPCGQILGTIYEPSIPSQTGASTVVEQQDAWLIRLDESPVVADAYYAGWDATGAAIVGGYTIHHAFSNSKQYTAWYGQSVLVTIPGAQLHNIQYSSTFWSVVNQLGSIGPGASGSGLFDHNAQLIGSLTLGLNQSGAGSIGVCPANPLVAPNGANGVGEFTALSAVFSSVADTSSTTGTATVQAALDPQHTGVMSMTGVAGITPIAFTADALSPAVGSSTELRWSAPNASGCIAMNGVSGDGWLGSLSASGAVSVSEISPSVITYAINCTVGTRQLTAQVTVSWSSPRPVVGMTIIQSYEWVNEPMTVQWFGNVSPCTLAGTGVNATGLAASGSMTVTESTPGNYQFTVSCGTGTQIAQAQQGATFYAPAVNIVADTQRLVGEGLFIEFESFGDRCVPSGGGTDQDWTGSVLAGNGGVWLYEMVAGIYTYTLTCGSGTASAQGSVTVDVENGPPSVSLTASSTSVPFGNPITLTWSSNVDGCIESEPTPNPSNQWSLGGGPDGTQVIQEPVVGVHTYVMTCGNVYTFGTAQNQVTVTVEPSTTLATLSSSAARVTPGESFTLTWGSTNAFICIGAGAVTDGLWNTQNGPSGAFTLSEAAAGTYTYTITCSAGNQSGMAQVIVMVAAASTGGGSTGPTGGGGGGLFDEWSLAAVAAAALARSRRRLARTVTCARHQAKKH
jgi:hypothetical protein